MRACPGILPSFLFRWRRDLVEVIGAALFLRARGKSVQRIWRRLRRPEATVRDWCRRFKENAAGLAEGEEEVAVAWGWPGRRLEVMPVRRCLELLEILLAIQHRRGRTSLLAFALASLITGGEWLGRHKPPVWRGGRTGF